MAAASTTTTLNDANGTALVAGDRVQATDSDKRGTVVSFTAKRVRIKWDGVDYPSTRHYAQVVPTKVRKIEADEEAEITAADQAPEVAPATAVTIRPEGAKRATRALVLSTNGTTVQVWIPSMGTPAAEGSVQDVDASAVQGTTALANCPGSWVVHNRRRASKDGSYEQLPKDVWAAFCEASDAHHAAYKAKHATKK